MRVLTIAFLQLAIIDRCCCVTSGMIWRKREQRFVQLFTIPQFAALREKRMAERRAMESFDMSNETIKAVFYEEKNIAMFHGTKVNGICVEVWYLLADYLNFTFIPIETTDEQFGDKLKNGTSYGMIGMLERNESQVILRSGFYMSRMKSVDYTIPIWKTRFHIYVLPQRIFDNKWVFTLFSPRTWYFIVLMFIVMSGVGYFLQKVPRDRKNKKKNCVGFTLNDHFFYSFAILCGQGYVPDAYQGKFKILSLSKSIFAWLVLLAFSSNLIYRMANRQITIPFNDLESFFNNTKYTLVAFHGSFLSNYIKQTYSGSDKSIIKRIQFVDRTEMHEKVCSDMNKYAMLDVEDRFQALNRRGCPLQGTGTYNETWITFAVKKNFRYKKTIDSALIKITEVGLLDALRDRWLNIRLENKDKNEFKRIDLHQVYLIFVILWCGTIISFVIFVVEKIAYHYEIKNAPP